MAEYEYKYIISLPPHPAGNVADSSVLEIQRTTSLTQTEQVTVGQLLQNIIGPQGPTGATGPAGPEGDPGAGLLLQGEEDVATINTWDYQTLTVSHAWLVTDAGTITIGTVSVPVAAGDMVIWTDQDYFINVGPATGGAKSLKTEENGGPGAYGTLTGLVNSSNTVYTTTSPYKVGSVRVVWNGTPLSGNNVAETDPGNGIITLGFAPTTGTWVQVTYEPV